VTTSSDEAESPVTLELMSWEEVQDTVAQLQGEVVVLDLWSTWCEPCVRELPSLVQLQSEHPDDVVCISFNMDYAGVAGEPAESFREDVLALLSKQNARMTNVLSTDPADDVFNQLELGSVPAVFVYDRDGTLVKRFDNDDGAYGDEGFTYHEHIVPLVNSLLAGEQPQTEAKEPAVSP
jgi:thiol-disulfide isomerase/thioredoxin